MSKKIVKNETCRLAATFFNNIAVGCVLLGLIGPVATGKLAHVFTLEFVYSEAAAWVDVLWDALFVRFASHHKEGNTNKLPSAMRQAFRAHVEPI